MRSHIPLGRVFGIPIGLHYSWFIIAALITVSLGGQFSVTNPDWSTALIWTVSVFTAVLFFCSILVHELAHALVSRAAHLRVRNITLFALGGVAQIEDEAGSASAEFWIAIVGPLTSAAIGVGCLAVAWSMGWSVAAGASSVAAAVLGWLGYINVALAVFNMIPGYPLDGGRVLRALLWGLGHDADRATRQAARTGQVVAFAFIAVGVLRFFGGAGIGGLWLAFIGWFLLQAAQASYTQVAIMGRLNRLHVGDVMGRDCDTVGAGDTIQQFVDAQLLRSGRRCYLVNEAGRTVGIITPAEVQHVSRDAWGSVTVEQAMRPIDQVPAVSPDTPAAEALRLMARENVDQLPVVTNGRLDGVVTRQNLVQVIRSRSDVRVA